MPSAAVLSRFSRLAYVWERLQEAAHTVKQISDELFRARDSAESPQAYGNLATVREGMDDISRQAELLETLRTELLLLLTLTRRECSSAMRWRRRGPLWM